MSEKVEKVEGGSPREFSAVKGQGSGARGPEGKHYEDKPACGKVKIHNDNKGE